MTASQGTAARHCLQGIDVLVLAGGLGTRVRAVLGDTPKLLAPIAGRPYLTYLLDWLARFGARRVILGLGHRAEAVLAYLDQHPATGLTLEAVVEPHPLGTAGAVRFARARLGSDPVMVMNGDSFCDADLCTLVARHGQTGAAGTLLCAEVSDAGRYGRVVVDAGGTIEAFVEKDTNYRSIAAVNVGVYLLSAGLLDEIAGGEAASLEREVFEQLPRGSLAALVGRFRFIDIGTPESLAGAAAIFAPPTT